MEQAIWARRRTVAHGHMSIRHRPGSRSGEKSIDGVLEGIHERRRFVVPFGGRREIFGLGEKEGKKEKRK